MNDKIGNPIEIAAVIVWQVEGHCKAVFDVDDYQTYVSPSRARPRYVTSPALCPYDNFEDNDAVVTLRGSAEKGHDMLVTELNERLSPPVSGYRMPASAPPGVVRTRIAGAMLQRQQPPPWSPPGNRSWKAPWAWYR